MIPTSSRSIRAWAARSLDEARSGYIFNTACEASVPEAFIAFLDSESFEDAIRKAISIGGDSDTIASIAGAIAQAFYQEIPDSMVRYSRHRLDPHLNSVIAKFWRKFSQ